MPPLWPLGNPSEQHPHKLYVGIEPTTSRVKTSRSTNWANTGIAVGMFELYKIFWFKSAVWIVYASPIFGWVRFAHYSIFPLPGIEPGPPRWKRGILKPLDYKGIIQITISFSTPDIFSDSQESNLGCFHKSWIWFEFAVCYLYISGEWFRSIDLVVMSHTRYLCATPLRLFHVSLVETRSTTELTLLYRVRVSIPRPSAYNAISELLWETLTIFRSHWELNPDSSDQNRKC